MTDVAIIGNGVTGNLTAVFLRQKLPHLDVTIIGQADPDRPIVGESTVEISAHFLSELGLAPMLIQHHFPKYGLSFYYKAKIDDPTDKRYVVDEAPAIPPFPSFQLNRYVFDQQLQDLNMQTGVTFIPKKAKEITIGKGAAEHAITLEDKDGSTEVVKARFVVDATGRRRFLGKQLDLHEKTDPQRSAFWFRLVDFKGDFLDRMDAIKKENQAYSSYFATHHLFGRGNWIWCIPMRTNEYENMISIGRTWRPDLCEIDVRSVEDFQREVGKEHPIVTDMVQSGTVLDTFQYRNYMYQAKQRYSEDGWFLVGDASDMVDPLYSAGLVIGSVQIRQIGALIEMQRKGDCSAQIAAEYNEAFTCFYRTAVEEVGNLYPVMHDPWKCHMFQHLTVLTGFHLPVPLLALDYMSDPVGVKLFKKLAQPDQIAEDLASLKDLIHAVGDRITEFDPDDFIKVQSASSMNWPWFEYLREEELPMGVVKLFKTLSALRVRLMSKLGIAGAFDRRQHADLAAHLGRAFAVQALLRGSKLRENPAVKWFIGAR